MTAVNKGGETPLDCAAQCSSCYKAIALNLNLVGMTPTYVLTKYFFGPLSLELFLLVAF